MAVRQSRGRYVVEFQQRGSRVFRRLPAGCTRAQAVELETKLRREAFDTTALDRRTKLTITAALGAWLKSGRRKNRKQADQEAAAWDSWVAGKPLSAVTDVAADAVEQWDEDGASVATINRRLSVLKAASKHAWRTKVSEVNYSAGIVLRPENNAREVFLTRAEVRRLAAKMATPQGRATVLLLAYTGLRVSELLALPKAPRAAAVVSVAAVNSKTRKARVVPVPEVARPLLRRLPIGLTYWQVHDEFLTARKDAKLTNVRIHDLRHTCASWLINAGVDLYTVGRILGHASPQTTQRYAHLVTGTLKRAMAKLR